MKLYYMPGACSLASHIVLIWSGSDYQLARLGHETVHASEFMHLNPKGAVPALLIHDAEVLTESLAILLYIVDCYPLAQLGAAETNATERARLNEMLAELVSDVHKAFVPTFVPERFTSDASAYGPVRSAAYLQIDRAFKRLESLMVGKDWLLFDRRTVADAYLYVMCRWKDKTPTPLASYPYLERFKKRLDRDPGIVQALSEEE